MNSKTKHPKGEFKIDCACICNDIHEKNWVKFKHHFGCLMRLIWDTLCSFKQHIAIAIICSLLFSLKP